MHIKTPGLFANLIMLLTIFPSCSNSPVFTKEVNTEQCSPYISLKFADGKRFVDERNTICRCRLYRFSNGYIGPIGSHYKVDIEKCSQMVGYPLESYENVNNFLQSLKSD